MNASATTISPAWSHTSTGTWRTLAAQIAVTGYLAGFSVLPNEWFHLGWLLLAGSVALVWKENPAQQLRPAVNLGACLIAAFVLWMTLRSCFSEAFLQGHASSEVMRGVLGTLLLALFCWRCMSALFCCAVEEALFPRPELLPWNMFWSTWTACCGSPFSM